MTESPSMDILVSSNLERLLYFLSRRRRARPRAGMGELAREGRYDVGAEMLGRIRGAFGAGCCDDARTEREIARVWREHGYLIDTHTAVASGVLADARAKGEQSGPCAAWSPRPARISSAPRCSPPWGRPPTRREWSS